MHRIFTELDKKYKYIIQAAFVSFYLFLLSGLPKIKLDPEISLVVVTLLTFVGIALIHAPNIKLKTFIFSSVLPLSVFLGGYLTLKAFPSLSTPFKLITIICFGFIYYMVTLIDNIFLVVHDRQELIPLYRAAIAWIQVVQIIVAIPLYTAIYRLEDFGVLQCIYISLISFIFNIYHLVASQWDTESKKVGIGEGLFLSLVVFFFQFSLCAAIAFHRGETFLRGLVASSGLMFSLNFVSAYLKNEISRKLLLQYFLIVVTFLLLFFFFKP